MFNLNMDDSFKCFKLLQKLLENLIDAKVLDITLNLKLIFYDFKICFSYHFYDKVLLGYQSQLTQGEYLYELQNP